MVSPQREELGRERERLTALYNKLYERWLSYIAYYLQSYNRELVRKKGTEQEAKVLESFDRDYMTAKENYEQQKIMLGDKIVMINQQIENMAAQGL
jgi:hypothetical protein